MISLDILGARPSRIADLEARLPHAATAVEQHFKAQLPDTRIVVAAPEVLAEEKLKAWASFAPDATSTAQRGFVHTTGRDLRWINGQTYITPSGIQIAIVAGRRGDLSTLLVHELTHAHQLNNARTREQEVTAIRSYLDTYELTRDEYRTLKRIGKDREREARRLEKQLGRSADKAARCAAA